MAPRSAVADRATPGAATGLAGRRCRVRRRRPRPTLPGAARYDRRQPADQSRTCWSASAADPDYGGRLGRTTRCTTRRSPAPGWPASTRRPARTGCSLPARPHPAGPAAGGDAAWSITGEQSNTSLVFGDVAILKVFRRLEPGQQPGHRGAPGAVRADGGAGTWPGCSATLEARGPAPAAADRRPGDAAGVLPNRHRRLGAGQDQRPRPVRRGRPARRRGRRRLRRRGAPARRGHRRGARRPGPGARRPASSSRRAGRDGAAGCARRLDAALPRPCRELAAVRRRAARGVRRAGRRTTRRCRCSGSTATTTSARCCGRSHGWVLLDFEGEPAKPLAERTGARLAGARPRRDAALVRLRGPAPARRPPVRAAAGLPRGRVGAPQPGRVLRRVRRGRRARPARADPVLLRAYEADKAVYEAVYEARNRPSWLPIPLRLAGPTHRRSTVVTSTHLPRTRPAWPGRSWTGSSAACTTIRTRCSACTRSGAEPAPPAPVPRPHRAGRDRPGGGRRPAAATPATNGSAAGGRRRPGQGRRRPAGRARAAPGRRAGSPRSFGDRRHDLSGCTPAACSPGWCPGRRPTTSSR